MAWECFFKLMKALSVMWVMPGYTVSDMRAPIKYGLLAIEGLNRSKTRSSSGGVLYLAASAMKGPRISSSLAGFEAPMSFGRRLGAYWSGDSRAVFSAPWRLGGKALRMFHVKHPG
jgi:hypothetical protein